MPDKFTTGHSTWAELAELPESLTLAGWLADRLAAYTGPGRPGAVALLGSAHEATARAYAEHSASRQAQAVHDGFSAKAAPGDTTTAGRSACRRHNIQQVRVWVGWGQSGAYTQ